MFIEILYHQMLIVLVRARSWKTCEPTSLARQEWFDRWALRQWPREAVRLCAGPDEIPSYQEYPASLHSSQIVCTELVWLCNEPDILRLFQTTDTSRSV